MTNSSTNTLPLRFSAFSRELDAYAPTFASQGFVLIEQIVSAEFRADAERQLAQSPAAQAYAIAGKKSQTLYACPPGLDYAAELRRPLAALFGCAADDLTLSERHLKRYFADAPAAPLPHKDRRASEFAVGIPLAVPAESWLALYPQLLPGANPYDSTARWRESLAPGALQALAGLEPVRLDCRPGDLVAFRGSAILLERRQAAGTRILYLKFNCFGLDPLGENLS